MKSDPCVCVYICISELTYLIVIVARWEGMTTRSSVILINFRVSTDAGLMCISMQE